MRSMLRAAALAAFALSFCEFLPAGAEAATLHVLYSFCPGGYPTGCLDGSGPRGALLKDASGNFFGTTYGGGKGGNGTAFELLKRGNHFKRITMVSFCKPGGDPCPYGDGPTGDFILDVGGHLISTTLLGGAGTIPADAGTVFRLTPGATVKDWSISKPHDFCNVSGCPDGGGPRGGVTYVGAAAGALYDGSSALYGTTQSGGTANGVVFQITPAANPDKAWHYAPIYTFCAAQPCSDGSEPQAALLADASGNLYGVTSFGGANNEGTLFELSPNGSGFTETVLYSFCNEVSCADGSEPHGKLIMDGQGHLLGTTSSGGQFGKGSIFEITPNGASSTETVRYSFCHDAPTCSDGSTPQSEVLIDAVGSLFGTTQSGGDNGGVVYRLKGNAYAVLYAFCQQASCTDGNAPVAGLISDSTGKHLYGTTLGGGAGNQGEVFDLKF